MSLFKSLTVVPSDSQSTKTRNGSDVHYKKIFSKEGIDIHVKSTVEFTTLLTSTVWICRRVLQHKTEFYTYLHEPPPFSAKTLKWTFKKQQKQQKTVVW